MVLKSYSSLLFFLLVSFSTPALADSDGTGSGNADQLACSTMLLDRAAAQGTGVIKPRDLMIFNSDIAPILQTANQVSPAFGKAFSAALNKTWRFGLDEINNCPTENTYTVGPLKKVACQTPTDVTINQIWYETLDTDDCKKMTNTQAILTLKQQQRDLFVHELLLGMTLGTNITQGSSDAVFAALIRQPPPTGNELQTVLNNAKFGVWAKSEPCDQTQQPQPLPDEQINNLQATVNAIPNQACLKPEQASTASVLVADLVHTKGNICLRGIGYEANEFDPKITWIISQLSQSLDKEDPLIADLKGAFAACQQSTCEGDMAPYSYKRSCVKTAIAQVKLDLSERICR